MIRVLLAALGAVCLFSSQAVAGSSDTTAQFDTETGLFVRKYHSVVAMANFAFWTGKWVWSGLKIETKVNGPREYRFSGSNNDKLLLKGSARDAS